jgi:hypothetical protein
MGDGPVVGGMGKVRVRPGSMESPLPRGHPRSFGIARPPRGGHGVAVSERPPQPSILSGAGSGSVVRARAGGTFLHPFPK